jgi:hypothetical protein
MDRLRDQPEDGEKAEKPGKENRELGHGKLLRWSDSGQS